MKIHKTAFSIRCLLTLMVSTLLLIACGDNSDKSKKNATAPTETKEAGHHDGDHEDGSHGKENHAAGEPAESDHEGGAHDEDSVTLTAAQLKAAGIELAEVGPAPLKESLSLYGVIAPNAERVREIGARFAGTIKRVDKKIGDVVQQGDSLAAVESNESLQTYIVSAPLTGVVTTRNANPGEQTGDKTLFTVADFSTVWVELSLYPRDVARVRIGQPVRVKSADAGLAADGTITYISPMGTGSNQTLTARVVLNNPERRWAPGLYVTADVTLSESSVPVAIRNDAVQSIKGRDAVFVRESGDLYEAKPVRLGRSDGIYSEVLDGLGSGATYVTTNSFVLKAELTKGEAEDED